MANTSEHTRNRLRPKRCVRRKFLGLTEGTCNVASAGLVDELDARPPPPHHPRTLPIFSLSFFFLPVTFEIDFIGL